MLCMLRYSAWDSLNRIWWGRDLQLFEAVSFSTAEFQITFLFLAAIKELVLLEQIISYRIVLYGSQQSPKPTGVWWMCPAAAPNPGTVAWPWILEVHAQFCITAKNPPFQSTLNRIQVTSVPQLIQINFLHISFKLMDTIQRLYTLIDTLMYYFQLPYLNCIIFLKQLLLPSSQIC